MTDAMADTWEAGLLDLVFLNVDFTGLGDAGGLLGSVAAGDLFISLHTADPDEGGDQTTNEAAYTSYARLAVARDATEWTRVANVVTNDNDLLWPTCTGGSSVVTHVGAGTASAGAGKLMYKTALPASLAVSNGITPRVIAGAASFQHT